MSSWRPPPDWGRPPAMRAREQLESARAQLEGLTMAELADASWRLHPRDHASLLKAGVDIERALGLRVVVVADPNLDGRGPVLTWDTN